MGSNIQVQIVLTAFGGDCSDYRSKMGYYTVY